MLTPAIAIHLDHPPLQRSVAEVAVIVAERRTHQRKDFLNFLQAYVNMTEGEGWEVE